MRNKALPFILLLSFASCQAEKEIFDEKKVPDPKEAVPLTLNGHYSGKNLYVQNPFRDDNTFCTYMVTVNDTIQLDSATINKSAFEIDLRGMNFKEGATVEIKIFHNGDCSPKVLNPEVH